MSGNKRPEKGTPEYDWLYGSAPTRSDQPAGQSPRPLDPDATQAMSSRGHRQSPPQATPPAFLDVGPADRPDQTQVLPTTPRATTAAPPGPPGSPAPIAPPPSGRRFRWGSLRWRRLGPVKVVLLLWLIFLIAVPWWAWSKIATVDADPGGDRPADQDGTTYLLVGSDSRGGLSERERRELGTGDAAGQRTDTIMLLHIGSGPSLLLSIPRDSIVEIPGEGRTKINAAYAFGGPKLLVKTVEQSTGIRIDNYVEIGLGGLVNVVDAVGGVEICPTKKMQDPLANLDIDKGCQQADGKTALGYARSRHVSNLGDIDRAKHQREVVSAIGSEAASPWSVLNPVRYVRLANAGAGSFTIDEETGPLDLGRFAWAMTRVNGDSGLTCGVPIADLEVNWDEERSTKMFKHIIEDDTSGIPKSLCTPSGLPK
jgi:LCP family protein required for cell wall assembly